MSRCLAAALIAVSCLAVASAPAGAKSRPDARFATFNASLNRNTAGALVADLSNPNGNTIRVKQARNVAEVIQRAAPDVVLVNEFDFYENGQAAKLFRDNFLAVSQNGAKPANYPYYFVAPSNTGIPTGFDLNNNGTIGGGDDAFGFGAFPGQFGMVVYSKFPIDQRKVRTFQKFLWDDMPGARMPRAFYSPEEQAILRLSSKSHWDVPIRIGRKTVHFLASHPTPPVFDGPEDRNGTRNADEIRFFADYITPGRGGYIYDDKGRRGGLKPGSLFVIAGDQNSDPLDGDSIPGAIQQLLDNPRVNSRNAPSSAGAVEASALQGGANASHRSDPRYDTADFQDVPAPGNLRADYVLPSRNIKIAASAVFWPLQSDPLFRLTGVFDFAQWGGPPDVTVGGFPTSDHRLVWADLDLPGKRSRDDDDDDDHGHGDGDHDGGGRDHDDDDDRGHDHDSDDDDSDSDSDSD